MRMKFSGCFKNMDRLSLECLWYLAILYIFGRKKTTQLLITPLSRTGDRQTMEGKQKAGLCKVASTGCNTQKYPVLGLQGQALVAGGLQGCLL